MTSSTPIWIMQGAFGRATVNLTDKALVEHAHQEFNVLFKLGGANTQFRSGAQALPLDDRSVLLFNPWVPHLKLANERGPTMILSLIIDAGWLGRLLASQGIALGQAFPNLREDITDDVRLNAERLATAIPRQLLEQEGDCEDLLTDLLDAVTRAYVDPRASRLEAARFRPIDYRIRRALHFIHEHALENPDIGRIAAEAGLSRSRFFEQFRRCVGVSPQHYIDHFRVKIATHWLSTTDRSLVEIAEELGFGSHSTFTRFFTQHLAVSPSEFRRQTALQAAGSV